MGSSVFKRREIKFMLTARQRAALEAAMRGHMEIDEYGESTICSLYYDTPDSLLIRRSLEKPVYKEKLRLRSYGAAKPGDPIYVELKKKYDGIVYKRRISMPEDLAAAWLAGRIPCPDDRQISREIDWVRHFYGRLVPALYLAYDRAAYFCPDDGNLRVTMDRNIRWRTDSLSLTIPPCGEQLLKPGCSLLEIKAADAMPLWLTRALSENGIRQISFSKYGTAYTAIQTQKAFSKGDICCA